MPGAIYLALDLAKNPILASIMRQQPLPPDVTNLIRIAAGETRGSVAGRDEVYVRAAAIFYIREILWANDADHYRVLGCSPVAPLEQISENLRWFVKWLHPDSGRSDVEPAFSSRVLRAWEAVKTSDRRREYDRTLASTKGRKPSRKSSKGRRAAALSARRVPWIEQPPRPMRRATRRVTFVSRIRRWFTSACLQGAWFLLQASRQIWRRPPLRRRP